MDTGTSIFIVGIIIAAIILSVSSFYFKMKPLMMISGSFWLLIGLFSIFTPTLSISLLLGIISLLMAVVMFFAPLYALPIVPSEPEVSYYDKLGDELEKRRYSSKLKPPTYL
jgi:uncharacterized membrane protein